MYALCKPVFIAYCLTVERRVVLAHVVNVVVAMQVVPGALGPDVDAVFVVVLVVGFHSRSPVGVVRERRVRWCPPDVLSFFVQIRPAQPVPFVFYALGDILRNYKKLYSLVFVWALDLDLCTYLHRIYMAPPLYRLHSFKMSWYSVKACCRNPESSRQPDTRTWDECSCQTKATWGIKTLWE